MAERIALVTAGGHIASFHAAMRRMLEVLDERAEGRFELVGARGGLGGLMAGCFEPIRAEDLEIDRAGSLIGADRKVAQPEEVVRAVKGNQIHAVVMMGGDNHLGEADRCHDVGVRVVGYPKTMDGDLSSFITLGWPTAVTVGAMQTRWHHCSAMTNRRVFYVGLFGRDTDWTLAAVTAWGGGDFGIPCEQVYELETILGKVQEAVARNEEAYGIPFAVVPYSEGAQIEDLKRPPDEHRSVGAFKLPKLQPEWIGMELVRVTKGAGLAACCQTHSYDMRDTPPTETDKRLSAMAGEECIQMILDGDFGKAVVFEPDGAGFFRTARRPLEEVAVQRPLAPTGFFDYESLRPTPRLTETYGGLFRPSLGDPPRKDDLVYRNLLRR